MSIFFILLLQHIRKRSNFLDCGGKIFGALRLFCRSSRCLLRGSVGLFGRVGDLARARRGFPRAYQDRIGAFKDGAIGGDERSEFDVHLPSEARWPVWLSIARAPSSPLIQGGSIRYRPFLRRALGARRGSGPSIGARKGRRLISILAPEQLFREDVMKRLGSGQRAALPRTQNGKDSKERKFLVFRLGDDEFGLPIEAVDEVARVPDKITRVPKTPKFL
jgi:CheW-like domain